MSHINVSSVQVSESANKNRPKLDNVLKRFMIERQCSCCDHTQTYAVYARSASEAVFKQDKQSTFMKHTVPASLNKMMAVGKVVQVTEATALISKANQG